jgi:hypothetical protein
MVFRVFYSAKNGYYKVVPCYECDRLSRVEIDLTRRAADAERRLHEFVPEPPFGDAVVKEFHACEVGAEQSRASLLRARDERVAHTSTHALSFGSSERS